MPLITAEVTLTERQDYPAGYYTSIILFSLSLGSGCVSVSYSETGGGGSGQDASQCIELSVDGDAGDTRIANNCDADVNFLEFSTASAGMLVIPANSTITQPTTVFAWGACIVPSLPQRTGDFDYYCLEP